jgi:hypothetical protein
MTADESLRRFGLVPADEALPQIRALLAEEADAERHGRARRDELALLCGVQLFSRGLAEDILRIWDAKQSGMDLSCILDVQLLCGAGLDETRRILAARMEPEAGQALLYLERSEAAGDFEDFSPRRRLDDYRRYFGVPPD